jgi:hypothetical protein
MRDDKRELDNSKSIGVVDECQTGLRSIENELLSYAVLINSADASEFESDDLVGVSISLRRMCRKLDKIIDKMNDLLPKK